MSYVPYTHMLSLSLTCTRPQYGSATKFPGSGEAVIGLYTLIKTKGVVCVFLLLYLSSIFLYFTVCLIRGL